MYNIFSHSTCVKRKFTDMLGPTLTFICWNKLKKTLPREVLHLFNVYDYCDPNLGS